MTSATTEAPPVEDHSAEPISDEQAEQHTSRISELTKHVVFVSPSMGWWKGHYKVAESSEIRVELAGTELDNAHITTPQTKLLECCDVLKDWKKRFQKIDSKRSALVELHSVPFPIKGVRTVPRSVFVQFMDQLVGPTEDGRFMPKMSTAGRELDLLEQSVAYQLQVAADEFYTQYDEVVTHIRQNVEPIIWERVSSRIPQRTVIRQKFYIDIVPVYLQAGDDQIVGHDEIKQYETHIRSSIHRYIEDAIETVVAEPRKRLAESLQGLHDVISRDGRVTQKSFKPVRDAIRKVRMFEFISSKELLQNIKNIEDRLNLTDPGTLNSVTATSNGLLTAIETLEQEVTSADKQAADFAAFGRPGRSLRF